MSERVKKKKFTVYFNVNLYLEMQVKAESMEKAIEEAKTYELSDVINVTAENGINDSEIEVTGVLS